MFLRSRLLILAYQLLAVLSAPATYDQRQTGDLNVQIHLKDVQVLALVDTELLDDYTEYDYFYDYADFTVKPITKPTTTISPIKPVEEETTEKIDESLLGSSPNSTNSTSGQSNENSLVEDTSKVPSTLVDSDKMENSTSLVENTQEDSDINETNSFRRRINDKTDENPLEEDEMATTAKTIMGSEKLSQQTSRKRCRSGYTPDGKGRCRRLTQRRLSLIPLAVKLGPKLLEDMTYSVKSFG